MPPLFDAYIMVDWSASSAPKRGKDSIWIGTLLRSQDQSPIFRAHNIPTRLSAQQHLIDTLKQLTSAGQRVLVGADFSLGYPAGSAEAFGLKTDSQPPWQAMSAHLSAQIEDTASNENNRFSVASALNQMATGTPHPFWGCPKTKTSDTLAMTKGEFNPPSRFAEFRLAEHFIQARFSARPKSSWQLMGAGAVGSQSLLGIPMMHTLRTTLVGTQLWPFETGFRALDQKSLGKTNCIIAEVYPSTLSVKPAPGEIIDQAQVRALCQHVFTLDSAAQLGACFAPPSRLNQAEIDKIEAEEGWILTK